MKPRNLTRLVAVLLPLFAAVQADAVVNITVNALGSGNVIRTDITRATFGTGLEHVSFEWSPNAATGAYVMATPTTATHTAIKNMNLGMLRFPHGTTAQYYYWNQPPQSYLNRSIPTNQVLTPSDIYNATSSTNLNMDRVLQVNTYKYRSLSNVDYPVITPSVSPATIHDNNLILAAQSAANWVTENRARVTAERVAFWEIGNEDWNTWTPVEYTKIFKAFSSRMKMATGAGANIKILAQSFTGNIAISGKPNNDATWATKLIDAGIDDNDPNNDPYKNTAGHIFALSEHEYLKSASFPSDTPDVGREKQTKNMFAQVTSTQRIPNLRAALTAKSKNWEIWLTEFNVWPTLPDGTTGQLQDLGHAIVIVDWVGRFLSQGVNRLFMHSIDDHPYFTQIDYWNNGASVSAPKVSAPGYAFAKFAQKFGPKMVTNSYTGNTSISSPNDGNYNQVECYSSVRESDTEYYGGFPSLRLIVVNRSTTATADVLINTIAGRPIAGSTKNYYKSTLTATNLTDKNSGATELVKWSTETSAPSNTSGISATLPKLSATLFIIPLQ